MNLNVKLVVLCYCIKELLLTFGNRKKTNLGYFSCEFIKKQIMSDEIRESSHSFMAESCESVDQETLKRNEYK